MSSLSKAYQIDLVDSSVKYLHGVKGYAVADITAVPTAFSNDFKSTGTISAGGTFATAANSIGYSLYDSIQVIISKVGSGFSASTITLWGSNVGGTDSKCWDSIQVASPTAVGSSFLAPGYSTDTGRKLYAFHKVTVAATGGAITECYIIAYGHK